jgi:hypothetical protein
MDARRIRETIPLLIIAITLAACGKEKPQVNPLDRDASNAAESFWMRSIVQCGDSFITMHTASERIIEVKDSFTVAIPEKDWKPTEADRLNKVEWKGSFRVTCKAYRFLIKSSGQWSEWYDGYRFSSDITGVNDIPLRKVSNKWEFGDSTTPRFAPVDCSQVPK